MSARLLLRHFATTSRRYNQGKKAFQAVTPSAEPSTTHTEEVQEIKKRGRPVGSSGRKKNAPTLSPASKVDLPPVSEWRTYFVTKYMDARDRVSIRNPSSAAAIANSFVPPGSKDKIIIEAFPGPGALTRALLQLPKDRIRKLIVLEDFEPYLEYLRPLEAVDPRIQVLPMRGFDWSTYHSIQDLGLLNDVETVPWEGGVHPQLHFISHLQQNIMGEQLVAQLFRSIPDRSWLFKYGRVPLSFILSDWVWQRISADGDGPTRCKLSVIAEAVSNVKLSLPPHRLQPYDDHFHPTLVKTPGWENKPQARRAGTPYQAVHIVPHELQVISKGMLDKWDYCLRRLFVVKSTPLKSAIGLLAPGSESLLKKISNYDLPDSERVNINTQVRKLKIREWAILLKAFDEWPFAPEDLLIGDSFTRDERLVG